MTGVGTVEIDPLEVRDELMYAIVAHIGRHPRSQQVAIGPSELGDPCARRIGYKLAGTPEANTGNPVPWLQAIGTALHVMFGDALGEENKQYPGRYLIEETVYVGDLGRVPILGHCDLYDTETAGVVDWKTVGTTQLKKYKAKGPGQQYRVQAHLYGRGWQLRGKPVRWVGIYFLPRADELDKAHFWHEPYDEQIALSALARADGIALALRTLGTDALARLGTADSYCHRCPWFSAGSSDPATGCPGHPGRAARTTTPVLTIS